MQNKNNKTDLISSLATNISSSDSDDLTNWNNNYGTKIYSSNIASYSNSYSNHNFITTSSIPSTINCNSTTSKTSISSFATVTIPDTIISEYLQEKEMDELLEKIVNRCGNDENAKKFIQNIIFSKIYSEDFVLKYYSYITDKATLKEIYSSFIKSQQYPSLALLLETDEK